jgi:hypothetical protein
MDPSTDQDARLLTELRRRRAELRESLSAVEHALASPSGAGAVRWIERLRTALAELSGDFREHISVTEGPDGLYGELQRRAPRLAAPVDRLTQEHDGISRRLEDLLAAVEEAGEELDAERIRRDGTDLLAAFMRHRQRGADLVFEAYEYDIGGET